MTGALINIPLSGRVSFGKVAVFESDARDYWLTLIHSSWPLVSYVLRARRRQLTAIDHLRFRPSGRRVLYPGPSFGFPHSLRRICHQWGRNRNPGMHRIIPRFGAPF